MADLYRDENLDRLVRELNDRQSGAMAGERASSSRGEVAEEDPLAVALNEMLRRSASDMLILSGEVPVVRVQGELVRTRLRPFDDTDIRSIVLAHASDRAFRTLDNDGACDFSIGLDTPASADGRRWRFRVNVHRQRGRLAAAFRALPSAIPTLEQLRLPPVLSELVQSKRGLMLICGPTGAGKTTTLAALVGEINRTSARHVVTIEDPIEFEHRHDRAIVEQIEIGRDAPSFAAALRNCLRQDPDVILIGEMRDHETVSTALRAAETGHLILATLHTADAAQAIHRMVDVFPGDQQAQIRQQLALSLHAVLCQQLLPTVDGLRRVPAIELLIANPPIRAHIRGDRIQQLASELTLGKRLGMITMEDSLASLVREGLITAEEAQLRLRHPGDLQTYL